MSARLPGYRFTDTSHELLVTFARPQRTPQIGRVFLAQAHEEPPGTGHSLRPGAQVTDVARRHGVSRGLLYTWHREAEWLPSAPAMPPGPDFVPVLLSAPEEPHSAIAVAETIELDRGSQRAPKRRAPTGGEIEVVLPCGARLTLRGRVEATALRAVLSALKA